MKGNKQMDMRSEINITLRDLFNCGRELILPKEPVSLYRYVEHLIEVSVKRKYNFKNLLELGPGADTIFRYLKPDEYTTGTLIDYNQDMLDYNKKMLPEHLLHLINMDVMDPEQIKSLNRKWDYIIANGVIEHLNDDRIFIDHMHELLEDRGVLVCSTVLHKWLHNKWDHAAGHYRRYSLMELRELFSGFREVKLIQSSILQELVRPLFYGRVKHLFDNTIEENNMIIGKEFLTYGTPPYAGIFGVLRYLMPLYLMVDWSMSSFSGGICFIIARK